MTRRAGKLASFRNSVNLPRRSTRYTYGKMARNGTAVKLPPAAFSG
jgi:hypothetical protein